MPASVDSKPLTKDSKSFRCNTYEKQGEGGQLLLTRLLLAPTLTNPAEPGWPVPTGSCIATFPLADEHH